MTKGVFLQSLKQLQGLLDRSVTLEAVVIRAVDLIVNSLKDGHKVLICGNGGSAADAQHMAAELVNRFLRERKALAACALTTDSSTMTSIANDYAFERVFARQIEALGRAGDVLVAISTSGNSPNVIEALRMARTMGLHTISLLGKDGGLAKGLAEVEIIVPSSSTPRIQEVHQLIIHAICEDVESAFA